MATSASVQQASGGATIDADETTTRSAAARAAQLALRELREQQAGSDYERIQKVKARREQAAR